MTGVNSGYDDYRFITDESISVARSETKYRSSRHMILVIV